jgi:pyruvate,water dikinase
MEVIDGLKDLFCFWRPPKPAVPFSVLFRKFKAILERNNRILELMADMGDKLGGEYVFDRQYIVDVCEQVNDLIFKLISDFCILTQSDNVELFIAFERIQHEIQEELAGRRAPPMIRPTVLLDELSSDLNEEAGNKFAALGDIRNILGFSMPDGFVITTKAFFDFMEYNGLVKHVEEALLRWDGKSESRFESICSDVRRRILGASIPKHMLSHLSAMLDILAGRHHRQSLKFAVRSSGWGEDGEHSFAGQYESVLNVPESEILEAYREVIASVYTVQAWQYRLHRGYKEHEMAMAVGCQLMVEAEVSGAMYTYAPLSLEKEAMVISAAWGLGPAVVQGIAESDTFLLDRSAPHRVLSQEIVHKPRMIVSSSKSGTNWADVPGQMREAPCLSAHQLEELARAATIIERFYKRPQDIEWAFDKQGSLYILQSRPLNIRPERPVASHDINAATRSAQMIFSGKGVVVQRGVASGKVYIARNGDALRDFPHGAILVAPHTSPKYARIMRKAHGIITDVGSATGHMATLAREYRIPTIVDTGVATKIFREGDEITLDATQNTVYKGRVDELSHFELTEQDVFEESYEYRLLRRLLKKISPLHLVDSHSREFKANRRRTYHDITRYIHEKAVEKLVDLSENYQKYHDKVPKKLETDLPLGLMVIDIEDGTNVAQDAKSVRVDQITSVPLRTLLEGLSEPGMWTTEPAAIDLSSFMSSVTRTFSPSFAVPGKSGRNLAVVSKEYLNLNFKLGYHFNLLDAYIGDTSNDNYLCFRFLGGVTDFVRRSRRARFIAEVLEQLDFRVEAQGDLVVGRLKKISRERVCSKMKVLGGLIGYTRQLDVSMNSDEHIGRYFADFMARIRSQTGVYNGCSRGV